MNPPYALTALVLLSALGGPSRVGAQNPSTACSLEARARDLGIPFDGTPGPFNAITDVRGVEVGFKTLIAAAALDRILAADRRIERQIEIVSGAVRYSNHHVRVHDVVNERDVLVPDALDVVFTESVAEQRWAFQRFDGHDATAVSLFDDTSTGGKSRTCAAWTRMGSAIVRC